jgi:hypothetical protein
MLRATRRRILLRQRDRTRLRPQLRRAARTPVLQSGIKVREPMRKCQWHNDKLRRRLLRRQAARIQPSLPKRISPSHPLKPQRVTRGARRRTTTPTRLRTSLRLLLNLLRCELSQRRHRSRGRTNWRLRARNIFTETACRKTALGPGQVCWLRLSTRMPRLRMFWEPCMRLVTAPLAICPPLTAGSRARCARIRAIPASNKT